MQSIKTYFADLSQRLGLADELIVLSPKRRATKQPMQLGEVQDQTGHYTTLQLPTALWLLIHHAGAYAALAA
ncbi:hypothetical protein DU490_13475 [Halomonas sp. DQ26W]|uniref:hypothetical protein n=1 Tax=Halomonas sp. DQ26W TaxID=2282311 RepID=UPI000DF75899|nr:hypothetical protein [Halomonas sp. DQ26W]RDB42414.1 hypothetical protein DU490_13475 [Halomonas sp. DQ26W]